MGFKLPNGNDLSEEQLDIINLPTTKNWVIAGAPGTGKTVMAIYRATQVSRNHKALLLVYNIPLMQFLQTAVKNSNYRNCTVSTYYQWLSNFYRKQFGTKLPEVERFAPDWPVVGQNCKRLGKMYEHIIIDEAQDFPIELIQILMGLSKNITCFIDQNQAIEAGKTNTTSAIKALCEETPYTLTRNFRNTIEIRNLSALFCKNGNPAEARTNGKKPTMIQCSNYDDQVEEMCRIIRQNEEKSVGIIVNNKNLKPTYNSLTNALDSDINIEVYKTMTGNSLDFETDGVKIVSYGTMKGLEFDIVLLPRFEKVLSTGDTVADLNRIYVATSRPLSELYMFYFDKRITNGWINTFTPINANAHLVDWK